MKKSIKTYYIYKGQKIPLRITLEWRKNVRIAIGKNEVFLRIPLLSSKRQIEKHKQWAQTWLDNQFESKPELLKRFVEKKYVNGQTIKINGIEFMLNIARENRKNSSAKINENLIDIKIADALENDGLSQTVKTLLSRVLSKYFYQEIKDRIDHINDQYVKEKYNDLRIKYNRSNWGSCSAKRNLNISSRLLFAPKEIQDYVFLHELTHLKELNHSKRFWSLIATVDPNFKEKEKWLKTNGHLCDF